MVGVSRQTIISIEKGNYAPSVKLALLLAEKLETTVEELFALEDSDRV
jgi:putative transcriptional regulator